MNNAQRAKAFAIWKECWKAIKSSPAATRFADEKDARMAVTRKATGAEKSWGSGGWSQREIDRLLGVMWAISRSADLDLQLRQIDQAFTRAEGSLYARVYLAAIGIEEAGRENYLNGICRRVHKKPLCDIDDEQWLDVLAALNHTALHKLGIAHEHPRSKWQRRGAQRAPAGSHGAAAMPATSSPSRTGAAVTGEDDGDPF